jgi:hypothetical protein
MTKKEIRRQINERFYSYVESNFPQYHIDHNEGGGRVYLIPDDKDDSIEYSQSDHTVCQYNYASPKSKEDCNQMEKHLKEMIIPYVEWLAV